MTRLSARRAKDRAAMAQIVIDRMTAAGALTVTPRETYSPREISLRIEAPGGAYMAFDIDGSLPDTFGGTWNTTGRVFLNPALGDVNPHHYGKLNRWYADFEYAVDVIARDLARFVDGSGYLPETDSRIVAMRERYEANGWQW